MNAKRCHDEFKIKVVKKISESGYPIAEVPPWRVAHMAYISD